MLDGIFFEQMVPLWLYHGAERPIFSSNSMEKFLPVGFGSYPEFSPSFSIVGSDMSLSFETEKISSEKIPQIPKTIPAKIIPIITTLFTSYFRKISL